MNRQRLMLMRHAKSDQSGAVQDDFDRPLNARGRKTAPRMGKWLKKRKLVPDVVISSPARRARETTMLATQQLRFPENRIVWDERIYGGSVPGLLAVIESHASGAAMSLLVGHNPGLENLLAHLCPGDLPLDEEGKLMTTGAIAVIVLNAGNDLERGSAELEELIRPREIDGG